MADQHSEYHSGPQSALLQGEYRGLLLAEDAAQGNLDADEIAELPVADQGELLLVEKGVDREEVQELMEAYDLSREEIVTGYAVADAFWRGMREVVGEDAAGAAKTAFTSQMSRAVQVSVDREMCLATPFYEAATDDQLAQFAETAAGKPLVEYWGEHAAGYLGIALARWDRINEVLEPEGVAELDDFIRNRLTPEERSHVWRALAG